jgi:probable rRNA maturation factor
MTSRVVGGNRVTCLITTDRELRELNRKFRGQDYATDVLSFPAGRTSREPRTSGSGHPPRPSGGALGEMAISFDRAAAQAAEHGYGIEEELRILMLHGLLHLAGMDHEKDSGEMARAEMRWRKRLGLPSGLIERTRR